MPTGLFGELHSQGNNSKSRFDDSTFHETISL